MARPRPISPLSRLSWAAAMALASLAPAAQAQTPPGLARAEAQVSRAPAGQALAQVQQWGTNAAAMQAVLRAAGRAETDVAATRAGGLQAGRNGVTHARLEQQVDGLPVHGAYAKAAFDRQGALVHLIDALAAVPSGALAPARVDALGALQAALAHLHPARATQVVAAGVDGLTHRFDAGSFFHGQPSASAVAVPLEGGGMERGWLVQTWTRRGNQLHLTLVGADGRILEVERRTARDTYNVFLQDPGTGGQTVVSGPIPGSVTASPDGWLGGGAQRTIAINGNNVSAYLDRDANDAADAGGTTVTSGSFTAAINLGVNPDASAANQAGAVQNMFHLNNVMHDRLYRHGFNEAAGNFQINNFGRGGAGNDPVNAEVQDGEGTDNANMSTPADGQRPRMQMYLWTGPGATHEVRVNSPITATYAAMGAQFGPAMTPTGITGVVAAASPADACKRVSGVSGKVALVLRGNCDFSVKVTNAQRAGATAVVVYNNVATAPAIFTMGGTATGISISAVMISNADGLALRALSNPNATVRKKAAQPLQVDSALDASIVYHEYCHGLTWRMIGGMNTAISGAIGEVMSDVCALMMTGEPVVGRYSGSAPGGIRRYSYAGYPLTYSAVTGAEVHDDGEIYAAVGWRLMELFGAGRRDDLFTYMVDGMNYTPSGPSFEAMRDGILAAVPAGAAGTADRCLVWQGFAERGIGVGSKATLRRGVVTVTESYAKPAECN